jgi:co-chaperonin GroES (HSP10)
MIKPLQNRILLSAESKKESPVMKADNKEKDRPTKGKVVACGSEYKGEVKKGDVCFFLKFNVESIESNGIEYFVALPEDLLATEK